MKRLCVRLLVMLVAVLCCAQSTTAQEPCRLERAVAPDYGGVLLGMRIDELARMFPGSQELQAGPRVAAPAASPFNVSLGMLELGVRKEAFKGVDELALTFLGGTLHRIDIRFRQPVPWKDIKEFSEHASKRLVVPSDSWDAPAPDALKQSRVLDCRGFAVVVRIDKVGLSTLSIVDTAGEKSGGSNAPLPSPALSPSPAKRATGIRQKRRHT
jgi:hypothetical protein